MCACEPSYVCSTCAGTPQDWRVELDEPEPSAEPATREPDGRRSEWL